MIYFAGCCGVVGRHRFLSWTWRLGAKFGRLEGNALGPVILHVVGYGHIVEFYIFG
jgi:hypothetical protein